MHAVAWNFSTRFAEGPDGGRDAKFIGAAELHPSKTTPWIGTTIIQAKHTNGLNRNFGESDFYSKTSNKTVLGEETIRIKKLRESRKLDHYMLFANRRLGANMENDIRTYISTECGIPEVSIYLCDVEQLEKWLKFFPEVAVQADLDPIDSPLIVSSDDLAEVVEAFSRQKEAILSVLENPPTSRVSHERKNELNSMTENYAKAQRRKYLKETAQIKAFLAAPENLELLQRYDSTVDDFQLKIIAKRKDYQTFDEVMEYLVHLLFNRDVILRQHGHRRITRAILFYMYWNCDIGEIGDA